MKYEVYEIELSVNDRQLIYIEPECKYYNGLLNTTYIKECNQIEADEMLKTIGINPEIYCKEFANKNIITAGNLMFRRI